MKHILVPPPLLCDNIDPAGLFPAGLAPRLSCIDPAGLYLVAATLIIIERPILSKNQMELNQKRCAAYYGDGRLGCAQRW
jgi:hypothetical protein